MAEPLLRVESLSKAYGGVQAVKDVSFTLVPGEILALIGPNGAGKSTCFNMVNGQIEPSGGRIFIDGQDTAGMSPRQIWRLGVGRTFQVAAVFSSMTVRENVQMALLSHENRTNVFWRQARQMESGKADEILELIGMASHADRPCAEMAYGDVKRLELAIALANDPKLLLMDEPAAGMAPRERVELMALTGRIARERNIGVLFTEHDMDVVFAHADRLMVLNRGELIAEGDPEEVRHNPQVRATYLGEGLVYDQAKTKVTT
ncbi:ABC transporter ATP-binding protein [Lutibaculum baratangense]|uniref:Branched-chain amino acid transport ATP-binding protein LivG n=1 Tax=Lutibaculum baratangense AMV1 TaxID=631454 RepID=V4T972_9HYPH|nr:ABC transporter ATP-binding protein [Lutibaculum baratangense]ESR23078.1 Branched-chain amino acid transport ATP-binding protein LivG [Lutibaculum baratangense AMV1]